MAANARIMRRLVENFRFVIGSFSTVPWGFQDAGVNPQNLHTSASWLIGLPQNGHCFVCDGLGVAGGAARLGAGFTGFVVAVCIVLV